MAPESGNRRAPQHWHLEKTVSVGHIITTITIAGSVLLWVMKMDSRMSVMENELSHSKQSYERVDREWRENMTDVKSYLIRIESKLDGKADKK